MPRSYFSASMCCATHRPPALVALLEDLDNPDGNHPVVVRVNDLIRKPTRRGTLPRVDDRRLVVASRRMLRAFRRRVLDAESVKSKRQRLGNVMLRDHAHLEAWPGGGPPLRRCWCGSSAGC